MTSTYFWYKEHHICVDCKVKDAEPHKTLCLDCLEKARLRQQKYRKGNLEIIRQREREDYKRRKEQKTCHCGKPVRDGQVLCNRCATKKLKAKLNKNHETGKTFPEGLRQELGICLRCNNPVVEGYYYCEEHLEKQREYMQKAIDASLASSKANNARKRYKSNG